MIYSPHTFELTLYLNYEVFDKLLKEAFERAKRKHRVIENENDKNIHYDEALKSQGIRIMFVWNKYKKRILFIVNPSKILGGDDIPKLWKPSKSNISNMLDKLERNICEYFNSEYKLSDFVLTRIDFTVNIDVGSRKKVSDYIKVLHNLGRVKGYSQVKDVDWIKKELAFVLHGNSNHIDFWVYDKEGREEMLKEPKSRIESARGILRVEIQLSSSHSLQKYTDGSDTRKQIKSLVNQSKAIFMEIFTQIIPRGDFYKKSKVEKLIKKDTFFSKKDKEKMLKLVENVPKKKSLLLAQKDLKSRDIKDVMKKFRILDICPVTISKRHNIKHLKSIYYYL